MVIQRNVLILIGILSLAYILVFLLSPKDITDYTVADTEYWRETNNRLLLKTVYDYSSKTEIESFPKILGEWKGINYKYPDRVYEKLNADILMSRAYSKNGSLVWMDIINSKTGESFHKQKICVEGAGWTIDNETIAEFKIADPPNPFTKLYANRLDISKVDKKTGKEKRQVMVYWFMFKKFGSNDSVGMIRLSSPVRNNTDETFNRIIKNFVEDQLFDAMYKSKTSETISTAEYIIEKYGNKGLFAMAMITLIPIGLTILGIRKKE